jgi:hypothetical protein
MVTAILIPIICLYFFWITKKEMKEQDQKWLSIGNIRQEAVLTGQIKDIVEEKQRFYYHRFIYVQELKLQLEVKSIIIKKVTPLTKNIEIDSFKVGETIRVYGMWEGSHFFFNHYEEINPVIAKR